MSLNPPPVLLPYQQRWCADKSPVKFMEKSRRIGLSWGEAADSALEAATQAGQDTWYIGYNKDMAQEFIRDCAMWAKAYNLAAGEITEGEEIFSDGDEQKSILTYVIRFASGHRITALSSRPTNLRGKQGRVIIDEAAFHDNLGELIKAALALLIWGGCVRVISTHDGADNPFNELVEDIRAGKLPYSLHRVTFDEALAEGLYRRICLATGKEWTAAGEKDWADGIRAIYADNLDEELGCIPKNSGGSWLSRALIEQRMSPDSLVLPWKQDDAFNLLPDHIREAVCRDWLNEVVKPCLAAIPRDARCFLGGDIARFSDLSVFAPAIETQGLTLEVPFLVELRNVPFRQQEQILFFLLDGFPLFLGAAIDAGGNGAALAEFAVQRYGPTRVQEIRFTESWYRQHMPRFKAALEDGTLDKLPQNTGVLDDLRAFQVIKGVPRLPDKRTKDQDGNKRHGDAGIALVLAHHASRELNKGPVTVSSRPRRYINRELRGYDGQF